jgi:hypothetical protein
MLESDKEILARIDQAPPWEKHFPAFAAEHLASIYDGLKRPAEAEKWRAERDRRDAAQKAAPTK